MESMNSSSPVGSNLDSFNGVPPSLLCTDVSVVPEHLNTELQKSILNLEGELIVTELLLLLLFVHCRTGWIYLVIIYH